MRLLVQRAALVLAVAAVAILCLSSAYLAAAIGIVTALVVAIDSVVFGRPPRPPPPPDPDPDRINVDLSRRR